MSAFSKSSANCLYEVAMAKDEVKARLAPIPVFTVANPKNEVPCAVPCVQPDG